MSQFKQLERPRFFSGQLLSAEDLQQEQTYWLERSRRHNRFLHGWGIVAGLAVRIQGGGTALVVEPGFALDCAGNELVLAEPAQVAMPAVAGPHYITIRYVEVPTAQLPSFDGEPQFSRARDSVVIALASTNPAAGHHGMGPGTPGCGQDHALCLARLSQKNSRWRVAQPRRKARRRRH